LIIARFRQKRKHINRVRQKEINSRDTAFVFRKRTQPYKIL
jgi:hypothetical protein